MKKIRRSGVIFSARRVSDLCTLCLGILSAHKLYYIHVVMNAQMIIFEWPRDSPFVVGEERGYPIYSPFTPKDHLQLTK